MADALSPHEPSRVEAIAVKIRTLVEEHGSPELRAAALALVETVQAELRELEAERGPTGAAPKRTV
ncbi:hypothetical protein [Methylobacterium sp. Leaf456]|uniref:hypothetical protein n=1 Tax=Methylobacterium sp. Leaf456 TaxID=1736382 RepID=UPI0012E395B4|nr:hypothetical protein [Methylobacterium sp. Leaf456]